MHLDDKPEESPPPKGALTLDQWKAAYDELQLAQARLARLRAAPPEGDADGGPEQAALQQAEAEVERLRATVEAMVGDYVASAERARKFASTAGRRQKLRARWHPEKPPVDGAEGADPADSHED